MAGLPSKFIADLARVDGVTAVMTWTIRYWSDQLGMGSPLGTQLIQHGTNRFHHLLICALSVATNAVALA